MGIKELNYWLETVAEPATGPDGSAEPGAQAQQDQDSK